MSPDKQGHDKHSEQWWRDWFNDIYLDVYAHRNETAADDEVQSALSILPLEKHERILDLCCGNGRHCRALQKAGYHNVVGIDYSLPLLLSGKSVKSSTDYIRADMRMLPCIDQCFEAVFSFFTSFGYFKTNIENIQVLNEISRVLRRNGRYMIDYLNPDYIKANFQPETKKDHNEYTIVERRQFSDDGKRVEKQIIIEKWGDQKRTFFESVQLYSKSEMVEMMESNGLVSDQIIGDFSGVDYSQDTPRMIFVGKKQ